MAYLDVINYKRNDTKYTELLFIEWERKNFLHFDVYIHIQHCRHLTVILGFVNNVTMFCTYKLSNV